MDLLATLALSPTALALAFAMAIVAGLIRGFTGFGATVTLALMMEIAGYHFKRQPGLAAVLSVGGFGGLLPDHTGVGGSPVVLYLLSTTTPTDRVRANIIIHIGTTAAVLLFPL